MALTRKFLSALGIDDDKVDEIIQAHTSTVNGLKEDIDKYKGDAEKLPGIQKELDKLKEEAAKDDGKNPYQVKYEALKEEFAEYKKGITEKETKAQKETAYRQLLEEAGVSEKRISAVLKVSDIDGLELEDGKVKNHNDLLKSIKEEWSDFITTESKTGAQTATPPTSKGSSLKSRAEIYARDESGRFVMDAAQRQAALRQIIEQKG